jgi:hypothetical protein
VPYAKGDRRLRSHGEFSGGPGLVDPVRRADRVLEPHEEVWEIYALSPEKSDGEASEADLDRGL